MMARPLTYFEARSIPEPNSGCWLWEGAVSAFGYGWVRYAGRAHHAHRAVWMCIHGDIPRSVLVCHLCDNRLCVNPDHLYAGTHRQNMDDAVRRHRMSRAPTAWGEKHPNAKLTDDEVATIRCRLAAGEMQKTIAEEFGVSQSHISDLRSGRRRRPLDAKRERETLNIGAA